MKYDIFSDKMKDNLANKCWKKIDNAILLGEKKLLERHKESFSKKISRVSLQIGMNSGISSTSSSSSASQEKNSKGEILTGNNSQYQSLENHIMTTRRRLFKMELREIDKAQMMFDFGRLEKKIIFVFVYFDVYLFSTFLFFLV